MYLRELPETTLDDLYNSLDAHTRAVAVDTSTISVDLTGDDPLLRFGDHTVEATDHNLKVVGDWVDVPGKFLERLPDDLAENLVNGLASRSPGRPAVFRVGDGDVIARVDTPDALVFEPRRLVEGAINSIGPSAPVLESWTDRKVFTFDTIVHENFDRGTYGDPQVGDLSRAGVRVVLDMQHSLSPSVQRLIYRLICTNGMVVPVPELKIDARGKDVDAVLADYDFSFALAWEGAEHAIEEFYALREQPVENPERVLVRIDAEHGLGRSLEPILASAPAIGGGSGATMFDVVNAITNEANAPDLINRLSIRRSLQVVGGQVVVDHAARCPRCASALNN